MAEVTIRRALLVIIFCLPLSAACDSSAKQGTEDARCYPNGTCNEGLTCLSNTCVRLPGSDKGPPDAPKADRPDLDLPRPDGSRREGVQLEAGPCPAAVWASTGSMGAGRVSHTATLLPASKVLIAGGKTAPGNVAPLASAEQYDATTGQFAPAGSMTDVREGHSATLLAGGKVLIAGGENLVDFPNYAKASAELYDPTTGFTVTGSLVTPRTYHSATLLGDGKVLIAAGLNYGGELASLELYDPTTGKFSATGSLTKGRYGHAATLLGNGKVLILGGRDSVSGTGFQSAELYDPATGKCTVTGSMTTGRSGPTATLLTNGNVLVAGGNVAGGAAATAELYDPATGTFAPTGSMGTARSGHRSVLLAGGSVLLAGGSDPSGAALSSAELFAAGTFTPTAAMANKRAGLEMVRLGDGRVLVTGGVVSAGSTLAGAELYSGCIGP